MCSIYGFIGQYCDHSVLNAIKENAKDRGRDGGRSEWYTLDKKKMACLGNWRAAPTTELFQGPLQPYEGLVHNGTIKNDHELGLKEGEIDSQVLARVVNRTNVTSLVESLSKVVGSYALACHNGKSVLLACNYKPIHYWSKNGTDFYFSSMARHFVGAIPRGQAPVELPPYTALDLLTGESVVIPRKNEKKVVVVCSGGLDSVTAAYALKAEGWDVLLLHFQYGCLAEGREVERIQRVGADLKAPVAFMRVPYSDMKGNSPILTEGADIAKGIEGSEYAFEWVPARNVVFLSLAIAYAEANGYYATATGVNLEEEGAFPDNSEQMFYHLNKAAPYTVQNGYGMQILSPVGNLMKHEIVKLGMKLQVPYQHTWSCYRDGEKHCNNCGPCRMRRVAFERNNLPDPVFS